MLDFIYNNLVFLKYYNLKKLPIMILLYISMIDKKQMLIDYLKKCNYMNNFSKFFLGILILLLKEFCLIQHQFSQKKNCMLTIQYHYYNKFQDKMEQLRYLIKIKILYNNNNNFKLLAKISKKVIFLNSNNNNNNKTNSNNC